MTSTSRRPFRRTALPRPSLPQATAATGSPALLVGTRKGAFILRNNAKRREWRLVGPYFLGSTVHHIVLDPHDRRTMLCAARAGHLGPTVFRSVDMGRTWKEAAKPPAFPKAKEREKGLAVDHVFWLTRGHPSEPSVWYAGTSPQGLFRSADGGVNWEGVAGFNAHPLRAAWCGDEQASPPDGATLHSINIDPRDPKHLYIGMFCGGTFESSDGGSNWAPLNKGSIADFLPDPNPEYGQDVHCMRMHPLAPDRLYQQNHCGFYRMDRAEGEWVRVGMKMPKRIGDIGFPLALHPRKPDTLWVFPMDGSTVWPRVSPDGKPAAYMTRNGGKTWQRQASGLPERQGWFTVKRQAMCTDRHEPVGVYFGTTGGEIWGSLNEGGKWTCLVRHLPEIYSLEAAELG